MINIAYYRGFITNIDISIVFSIIFPTIYNQHFLYFNQQVYTIIHPLGCWAKFSARIIYIALDIFGFIHRPSIRILIIVICTRVVTRTDFQCTAPNSVPISVISWKRPYLSQMDNNHKKKGTLLSQTLKVGEKKVPSEFTFLYISISKSENGHISV